MFEVISSRLESHKDTWRERAKQDSANLPSCRSGEEKKIQAASAGAWLRRKHQQETRGVAWLSVVGVAADGTALVQDSILPLRNWFSKKVSRFSRRRLQYVQIRGENEPCAGRGSIHYKGEILWKQKAAWCFCKWMRLCGAQTWKQEYKWRNQKLRSSKKKKITHSQWLRRFSQRA